MLKNIIEELEIEMTTLCNASCPLCYRNYKLFPQKYKKPIIRNLYSICNQLNKFPKLKYVMIVGSMSEPTLYPYLIELIKYLKKRNIQIEICTNGSTHNEIFWKNLGKNLSLNDKVYFTICGSTQEIHEKYRVGTNLQKILNNANALRSIKPIDYAQCIRFNYNSEDFDSKQFKNIINQFSHIYMTETFYPKDLSNYNKSFDITLFLPNKIKLEKYNYIKKIANYQFINFQGKLKAYCQSYINKRCQLDVFGNIYPCYLFLEYSNLKQWNYTYNNILKVSYECCKYCEYKIYKYCEKNNLEYII